MNTQFNVFDFLNSLAAASLALAALVSLLTIFRGSEEFNETDKADFKGIILLCISTIIGSYIPMVLSLVLLEAWIWGISSILYVIVGFGLLVQLRADIREGTFVPVVGLDNISRLLQISSAFVIIMVFLNIFVQSEEIYVVGLFWGFGLSAIRLYLFLDVVVMQRKPASPEGESLDDKQ